MYCEIVEMLSYGDALRELLKGKKLQFKRLAKEAGGALLYGIGDQTYAAAGFSAKAKTFNMTLPLVHSVILNRSTQYNKKASKAFGAMFDEIKKRVGGMKDDAPQHFVGGKVNFAEIPDNHSVAIVCSHLGRPLFSIKPDKYEVYEEHPQINSDPLDRYKQHVANFIATI
jgi:hypothetical protein